MDKQQLLNQLDSRISALSKRSGEEPVRKQDVVTVLQSVRDLLKAMLEDE